jgi:hypothetical protein
MNPPPPVISKLANCQVNPWYVASDFTCPGG